MMSMKFPFHITLLTLLLSLLLLTGAAIGITSYLNTRQTVEDLSQQILGHASIRIDHQINNLLLTALKQCKVSHDLMESPQFSEQDLPKLAANWKAVVKQNPWFRVIGFTRLDTGESWHTLRDADGNLFDPIRKRLADKDDPRKRPPFVMAQEAGKQIWTETYMLRGNHKDGEPSAVPGLSCAIPIKRQDGALFGVFSVTFDLGRALRISRRYHCR